MSIYLTRLIAEYGYRRVAKVTGIFTPTLRLYTAGIRKPTALRLVTFRNAYRRAAYDKMRTNFVTAKTARLHRLAAPKAVDRVIGDFLKEAVRIQKKKKIKHVQSVLDAFARSSKTFEEIQGT